MTNEAGRVSSFGSLLLAFYGDVPPVVRSAPDFFCNQLGRSDRFLVWFQLKCLLEINFVLASRSCSLHVFHVKVHIASCNYKCEMLNCVTLYLAWSGHGFPIWLLDTEIIKDFQAFIAPFTPLSSNHIRALPRSCHTNLFSSSWCMVIRSVSPVEGSCSCEPPGWDGERLHCGLKMYILQPNSGLKSPLHFCIVLAGPNTQVTMLVVQPVFTNTLVALYLKNSFST